MKKLSVSLLLLWLPALSAMGQTCDATLPSSAPAAAFKINEDGTATHKKTKLTWMRCALGQTWDGATCTGDAQIYTWEDAQQAAADKNATEGLSGSKAWHVPTVAELASVVEYRCFYPAISTKVFPNTPSDAFWSSSPFVGYTSSSVAWGVNFGSGYVTFTSRLDPSAVRLVRAGQ